ncbi:MAG: MaoC family dehydratase [Pseudomonadota bacterium]|nr:MaoC family dehydratase [Pseudomonadota bacterium]
MNNLFEPENHHFPKSLFFEDLRVGEKYYIPSRTLSDANFAAFQSASADNHPIHYDIEYCRNRGYPNLLAHGFQVLIQTAAGAGNFAHLISDSLVAFVEQSSKFVAPVFSGDTVYPELEIAELVPQNTTGVVIVNSRVHNQRKQLVLEGMQKYVVRKRSKIN